MTPSLNTGATSPAQRVTAPEHSHRQGGEDGPFAVDGGEDHHDHKVQDGFGVQGGRVAGEAVLNGAYDGHSPDAHGEEAVTKPWIK